MHKFILSMLVAAGFAVGTAVTIAAEEATTAQPPAATAQPTTPQGVQPGQAMQFNPAHPSGWAMFVDPRTHQQTHTAFMNPAQYAQFMSPQFMMQFADPNNMMAWMNPAAYATFMNPATYMYWMNPGSYAHMMNPALYMQSMNPTAYNAYMNPNTYMQWMNPGAYAMPAAATTSAAPFNFFDPNAWTQSMAQVAPQTAQQQ